jgi:polyisoprenoid-binding protein YceI
MRNSDGWKSQRFRVPAALLALLLLSHCATSPPPEPSKPAATVIAPATPAASTKNYQIDTGRSQLQILVYRGGKLAALGHNHVIASHDLTGSVLIADPLTATRFDLRLPVSSLTVDEPELRRQAGADFQAEVPQSTRDGTRRNLLSGAVLDADHFAEIRLLATYVQDLQNGRFDVDVDVDVEIKGQTHRLPVSVQLQISTDELSASGELAILQTDLGLTPFTALLGALTVENRIVVRFQVVAKSR